MKETLLGVTVSESKNQRLGRSGWGHIPDHLASTGVSRGGNLWPSLLSLRGRQAGGKAWVGFPELPQAWERLSHLWGPRTDECQGRGSWACPKSLSKWPGCTEMGSVLVSVGILN